MWRMGERTGHGERENREEVRESRRERDREEEMEDQALGGQGSISTPEERGRSVHQHLPHYRPPPLGLT